MAAKLAVAIILLMPVLAATPAAAQGGAGSVVFLRDANVWVMPADDPAAARAVTTDGTDALFYEAVAQDDAGTIVAGMSDGSTVRRLDRDGNLLGEFTVATEAEELGAFDLSRDGTLLAYTAFAFCGDGSGLICYFSEVERTDGSGPVGFLQDDANQPSWYGNQDLVFDRVGVAELWHPFADTTEPWFQDCPDFFYCPTVYDPEITRDGTRLISDGGQLLDQTDFTFRTLIRTHTLDAPPPALPTHECDLQPLGVDTLVEDFTWSPDGTAALFREVEVDDLGVSTQLGIFRISGFGDATCDELQASIEQVLPGGAFSTDWGPAPAEGGGGPVTPPLVPGGDLVDGGRLDGGGAADPVAQAIATSRALFADGAADRVVLATADRFPDALAGAALAGSEGPILLTAGSGGLDPRVGAEIARVTGGGGLVLTLGGVAAVSEQAAVEARAAAGNQPCAAPFPDGCRYAGSGREHTAALIAGTVLSEHPGTTVMVARGDEFADAITGGAFAAASGVPILLTPSNQVNTATAELIQTRGIDTAVVLGGPAAIDEATYQALPVATRSRVAGAERTATSAAIAQELWQARGLGAGGTVFVNVRAPNGWQTALTAAVVSAVHDAPQLGVETPPAGVSDAVMAYLAGAPGPVHAFGGTDLVSDAQLSAAVAAG